jgi:hypothetical protein
LFFPCFLRGPFFIFRSVACRIVVMKDFYFGCRAFVQASVQAMFLPAFLLVVCFGSGLASVPARCSAVRDRNPALQAPPLQPGQSFAEIRPGTVSASCCMRCDVLWCFVPEFVMRMCLGGQYMVWPSESNTGSPSGSPSVAGNVSSPISSPPGSAVRGSSKWDGVGFFFLSPCLCVRVFREVVLFLSLHCCCRPELRSGQRQDLQRFKRSHSRLLRYFNVPFVPLHCFGPICFFDFAVPVGGFFFELADLPAAATAFFFCKGRGRGLEPQRI